MEKDYWLTKWQSNDIAFHQQHINPDLITYLHHLDICPGDNILVPLCGKTRDMLWLADKGYNVFGIELSPIACREFFAELNVDPQIMEMDKFTKYVSGNIELFCGDFFDLTSNDLPAIHAVYDCRALVALPLQIRKKYVDHLVACFGINIALLVLTLESSSEIDGPPFSVDNDEIHSLYASYFKITSLKLTSVSQIPAHLVKKGYTDMKEGVYLISNNASYAVGIPSLGKPS